MRAAGKARFYNAPLLSYLRDKLMVGAIVAMDDPWQEEAFSVPARGHYGQAVLAHELASSGDFRTFFCPPKPVGALGAPLGRAHGPPPAAFLESMRELARGAELAGVLEPGNTIAVRHTRSRFNRSAAEDLALRVSLTDASGAELASAWVSARNLTG